jgi:hypothetical protein
MSEFLDLVLSAASGCSGLLVGPMIVLMCRAMRGALFPGMGEHLRGVRRGGGVSLAPFALVPGGLEMRDRGIVFARR